MVSQQSPNKMKKKLLPKSRTAVTRGSAVRSKCTPVTGREPSSGVIKAYVQQQGLYRTKITVAKGPSDFEAATRRSSTACWVEPWKR
jgi:hypothetical protein